MPDSSKNDRSPADAKADAKTAINGGATKLTLLRKAESENYDVKITMPDPAGPDV